MYNRDFEIEIKTLVDSYIRDLCEGYRKYEIEKNKHINNHIIVDDENDRKDRILIWESRKGNNKAKELFILDKMEYVRRLTSHNAEILSYKSSGLDEDDLFQTGLIGVIDTIKKYDFRLGTKVHTFLTYNIKFSIKNMYRKYGMVSISREYRAIYRKCCEKINVFDELLRSEDIDRISNEMNIEPQKIEYSINAIKSRNNICSINNDGVIQCDSILFERYKHKLYNEIEEKMNNYYDYITILDEINKLNSREHYIMQGIFIDDKTQKEISKELNISIAAVGKIKNKAIKNIRKKLL